MTSLRTVPLLASLVALLGSAILVDATPSAYAQTCANGVCP